MTRNLCRCIENAKPSRNTFHTGDFGITVLLSGSKVVRLNTEDNIAVINGETLDLTDEDYIYNKQKLYLTEETYRRCLTRQ